MSKERFPWKKYVVRLKESEVEGLYPSSSSFPTLDPKTVASRCRSKDKTPDENGFVYYRLEDYQELERSNLVGYLSETYPQSSISFPDHSQSLNLVLTIGGKIVSVNDLYKAKLTYVKGKPVPSIYKNPKAKKVSEEIYKQLGHVDFSPWVDWLKRTKNYKISINFVVKSGISRRDTENLGKSIIDTVVRHIKGTVGIGHFDDSEFLETYFTKSIIPGSKHEYALISLTESSHDIRFDNIPSPDYYYLEGEWLEDWKETIIKAIEDKGWNWYSPELNPWEPWDWGLYKQDKCNTLLKVVNLGNIGGKEFKELYDEIKGWNNQGGKKFLRVVLVEPKYDPIRRGGSTWGRYSEVEGLMLEEMRTANIPGVKVILVNEGEDITKILEE